MFELIVLGIVTWDYIFLQMVIIIFIININNIYLKPYNRVQRNDDY